jgi:hypothetical protein
MVGQQWTGDSLSLRLSMLMLILVVAFHSEPPMARIAAMIEVCGSSIDRLKEKAYLASMKPSLWKFAPMCQPT